MKLVSLNIELERHTQDVLDFLKKENPDVICLQEFLEQDFELFKKELHMEGVFQLGKYLKDLNHPESIDKREGLAIFAKNIASSLAVFYLGSEANVHALSKNPDTNNDDTNKNKLLLLIETKDIKGNIYKFITTHFTITKNGDATLYQLEVLDKMMIKLDQEGEFIFCGDMNAPRGRETFDRLARTYRDNIPSEYKTSIDPNLHRVKGLELMVDGLFTTPLYEASGVRLVDGVSDHMAIVAEINKK